MKTYKEFMSEKVQPKNANYGFLGTIKDKKQLRVAVSIMKKAGLKHSPTITHYLDSPSGRHLADMMNNGDSESTIVAATKENLKAWMKNYDPEYFKEAIVDLYEKNITLKNMDFGDLRAAKRDLKKHRIKFKVAGRGPNGGDSVNLTGKPKDLIAYLTGDDYGYELDDLKDAHPELFK